MPSRKLTTAEAATAEAILLRVKTDITQAADGDPVLQFALRRRTFIRLMYWERSTPAERRKLQIAKHLEQGGICFDCGQPLDLEGAELDRIDPVHGYTMENTHLVHHACHRRSQEEKGFA